MSTRNLNKKRTIIISIAAVALTACITTAAILLTNRSSAVEVETATEAETISETETYTIKPIPHTTKKREEPKEITEIPQETEIQDSETVTFAPVPETEDVIINNSDAAILEEYSEYTNDDFEYITGEEIMETLSSEDTQATEAPVTTAATTTLPPEEIDWSGIVDDGFVDGGNETGHKPGDGGIGEIGDTGGEPIVVIGC